MSDIVERLRRWTHAVDARPACDLMDEAATEIERLRQSDRPGPVGVECQDSLQKNLTLTDEEREAVELAANRVLAVYVEDCAVANTLRGLLERLK